MMVAVGCEAAHLMAETFSRVQTRTPESSMKRGDWVLSRMCPLNENRQVVIHPELSIVKYIVDGHQCTNTR